MTIRSRTSKAGSVAGSDFAASTDINALGGSLIGYSIIVGQADSGITSVDDFVNWDTSVTVTPTANRILRLEWCFIVIDSTAQGTTETFELLVYKDGSQFTRFDYPGNPGAGTNTITVNGFILDVDPTAASHTYKLKGGRSGTAIGMFTVGATGRTSSFVIYDESPTF